MTLQKMSGKSKKELQSIFLKEMKSAGLHFTNKNDSFKPIPLPKTLHDTKIGENNK